MLRSAYSTPFLTVARVTSITWRCGGQKLSCFTCSTCGSRHTWSSTASGIGASTSTRAMASPPGRSRPRWKVAMLICGVAQHPAERADQARLVLVADIEHVRAEPRLDRDAADRDQPRLGVLEQRAGHRARPALGHHLDGEQRLVVVDRLAGHHPDVDVALLGQRRGVDHVDAGQQRPQQAGQHDLGQRPGVERGGMAGVA